MKFRCDAKSQIIVPVQTWTHPSGDWIQTRLEISPGELIELEPWHPLCKILEVHPEFKLLLYPTVWERLLINIEEP